MTRKSGDLPSYDNETRAGCLGVDVPIRPVALFQRAEGDMGRKDETIICTTCPITGGACLQGHALLTRLSAAIGAAGDTLDGEFEISGAADVAGCGRSCRLAWRATRDEAWLAGDVDEEMPEDQVWAAARAGRGLVIATRRVEMVLN